MSELFIYYCPVCSGLDSFEGIAEEHICPACGKPFLPLRVTVDEWNDMSNSDMLAAIESAKKPKAKPAKILPPAPQPTTLVPAKCTNCGGVLDVDPSQEAAVCRFCDSAFIVQKAIQNYNLNIQNSNITIAHANIQTGPSVDNLILRAKEFASKHDFQTAKSYYNKVLDIDVNNRDAREGLDILNNYVHSVYRVHSFQVGAQIINGFKFFLTAYFTRFIVEQVAGNNVVKVTGIPFEDITKIDIIKKNKTTCGVRITTKANTTVLMYITPEQDRDSLTAANEIKNFFSVLKYPDDFIDRDEASKKGQMIVKEYFKKNKPSIFTSSESLIVEATYRYMKCLRIQFKDAIPIVKEIAYSKR